MRLLRRFRAGRSSAAAAAARCACGAPLDPVDLNYGFGLPDEVFALTPAERASRVRGLERVFVLDQDRGFVRTLLPVDLDHGSLTLGVWLEIGAPRAVEAIRDWDLPGYLDLTFEGVVANTLEPWGAALYGAHASARPESHDELPRIRDGDAVVRHVLTHPWPRDEVLISLPEVGHSH